MWTFGAGLVHLSSWINRSVMDFQQVGGHTATATFTIITFCVLTSVWRTESQFDVQFLKTEWGREFIFPLDWHAEEHVQGDDIHIKGWVNSLTLQALSFLLPLLVLWQYNTVKNAKRLRHQPLFCLVVCIRLVVTEQSQCPARQTVKGSFHFWSIHSELLVWCLRCSGGS